MEFKEKHPDAYNRLKEKQKKAGKIEDIKYMTGVYIDIDPVRDKNIPSNDEEHQLALDKAQEIVKDYEGAVVIDSGNGAYVHASFEPIPIRNKEDREIYGEKLKQWLKNIKARYFTGEDKLECDMTVAEMARLMKLPGTLSVKGQRTPERPHRLARVISSSTGLKCEKVGGEIMSQNLPVKTEVYQAVPVEEGLEDLTIKCEFLEYCRTYARTLPEPLWYPQITNLARLGEEGKKIIHKHGSVYPGYSYKDTEKKIKHALKGPSGPHKCKTIAELGYQCSRLGTCPVRSPAALIRRRSGRVIKDAFPGLDISEELIIPPDWVVNEGGIFMVKSKI